MREATAHDPDTLWLDAERAVRVDVPCVRCRYNLRSLPAEGRCPECGTAVADSRPLWCEPPWWLRRLSRGTLLLIAALLLYAVDSGLSSIEFGVGNVLQWVIYEPSEFSRPQVVGQTISMRPSMWESFFLHRLVSFLCLSLSAAGVLYVTTRLAETPEAEAMPRRAARISAFTAMGLVVGTVACFLITGHWTPWIMVVYIAMAVSILVALLMLLLYVAQLCIRLRNTWLHRVRRIALWLTAPAFLLLTLYPFLELVHWFTLPLFHAPYARAVSFDPSAQPGGGDPNSGRWIVIDESNAVTLTDQKPPDEWLQKREAFEAFDSASDPVFNIFVRLAGYGWGTSGHPLDFAFLNWCAAPVVERLWFTLVAVVLLLFYTALRSGLRRQLAPTGNDVAGASTSV